MVRFYLKVGFFRTLEPAFFSLSLSLRFLSQSQILSTTITIIYSNLFTIFFSSVMLFGKHISGLFLILTGKNKETIGAHKSRGEATTISASSAAQETNAMQLDLNLPGPPVINIYNEENIVLKANKSAEKGKTARSLVTLFRKGRQWSKILKGKKRVKIEGERRSRRPIREVEESSNPPLSKADAYCSICMEPKLKDECFALKNCSHMYCSSCVGQYVEAKVEENVIYIGCPDPSCKHGYLEPEMCRLVLKPQVFNRWGQALCEAMIGKMKFYCPFKDCSALLMDERVLSRGEVITQSECPHCFRLFCAQCKVPWHSGVGCAEFAKLGANERGREDIMLRNMAKQRHWQRCPACNFYVERISGCMFVKCRCGHQFCYGCATPMTVDHFCRKCRR